MLPYYCYKLINSNLTQAHFYLYSSKRSLNPCTLLLFSFSCISITYSISKAGEPPISLLNKVPAAETSEGINLRLVAIRVFLLCPFQLKSSIQRRLLVFFGVETKATVLWWPVALQTSLFWLLAVRLFSFSAEWVYCMTQSLINLSQSLPATCCYQIQIVLVENCFIRMYQ